MSTPGERLRQLGQHLDQQRRDQERHVTESDDVRQARQNEISRRVRTVGQACLSRAQQIRDEARYRINLQLDTRSAYDSFSLEVGYPQRASRSVGARFRPESKDWEVEATHQGGKDAVNKIFKSDEEFEKAFDELLEPLMEEALRALFSGEEEPSPER